MISLLKGIVHSVDEKVLVLMTSSGVGYQVFPAGTLLSSCKIGEESTVEIHTIVRETEISLYGFGHGNERNLFQKLIAISGVGPKIALQIVSTPVAQFQEAVMKGDVDFISRIPGLGKKTAQKIIIELKGKVDLVDSPEAAVSAQIGEATEALKNLGYDHSDIKDHLDGAPVESSAEDLVRYFLQKRNS